MAADQLPRKRSSLDRGQEASRLVRLRLDDDEVELALTEEEHEQLVELIACALKNAKAVVRCVTPSSALAPQHLFDELETAEIWAHQNAYNLLVPNAIERALQMWDAAGRPNPRGYIYREPIGGIPIPPEEIDKAHDRAVKLGFSPPIQRSTYARDLENILWPERAPSNRSEMQRMLDLRRAALLHVLTMQEMGYSIDEALADFEKRCQVLRNRINAVLTDVSAGFTSKKRAAEILRVRQSVLEKLLVRGPVSDECPSPASESDVAPEEETVEMTGTPHEYAHQASRSGELPGEP